MYRKIFYILFSGVALVMGAASFVHAQTVEELQSEVNQLKSRVRSLEDYVLTLKPTLDQFNENNTKTFNNFFEHTQKSLNDYAQQLHQHVTDRMQGLDNRRVVLDAVNHGYREIQTSSGSFLISVKSFKPVFGGSGYRLTFHIGNPNYASYRGINLKLSWGEKYNEKSLQSYDQWKQALRTATFKYNGKFNPGAWTEFGVDVPAESAKELGYLECEMEMDAVELNLRNPQVE